MYFEEDKGFEDARLEEARRKRIAARREKQRRRRRQQIVIRIILFASMMILLALTVLLLRNKLENEEIPVVEIPEKIKYIETAPDMSVELIDINEYSRPGTALDEVNGVVVHYTGNPGTTAAQNRSYFQNLSETGEAYASSHFVIGIEGEIIQCVPCNEIAYASNDRNSDTISIECCIPDDTGKFTQETYDSLVELVAWLMGRYELTIDEIIRHYDVTGKECPRYYVKNEDAWIEFKETVVTYIDTYGIEKEEEIN